MRSALEWHPSLPDQAVPCQCTECWLSCQSQVGPVNTHYTHLTHPSRHIHTLLQAAHTHPQSQKHLQLHTTNSKTWPTCQIVTACFADHANIQQSSVRPGHILWMQSQISLFSLQQLWGLAGFPRAQTPTHERVGRNVQRRPCNDSDGPCRGLMNTDLQSSDGLFVTNDLIQLRWTILLDPAWGVGG